MSVAVTAEHKLFLTRAKSVGEILKGLTVAAVGGTLVVLLAYRTENPGFLILGVAPLGYGWHLIAIALPGLFRRVISDAPGTARMGDLKDLMVAGLITKSKNRVHDFYCGELDKNAVYYSGDRHIITMGSTRRGKDTGLTVQNLALLERSFVVIDPSGELAAITMKRREKLGPVIIMNPFGVLTTTHPHLKSVGFNPLAANFSPSDADFYGKAMGFAEALIKRGSVAESKHWISRARGLVAALIMQAKWFEHEGKVPHATIGHVNEMLTAPLTSKDKTVKTLQGIMEKISKHKDKQMVQLATSFIEDNGDDKEVKGVIATALGDMTFLNDRTLIDDLGKHPTVDGKPFDFEMLKHRIITVYVILPDDMLSTYSVWLRLVISSAMNAMKRTIPGPVRPVLLLNEIGNLGYMESLETGMGMAAKKGVTIWTVWQSLAQISRIYGDHGREMFISGAGVLNSFKADDWETAEYISKRLGRRTEVLSSYSLKTSETDNASKTDSASGFPLMHPDQIMALPPREMLSWIEPAPYPVKLNATGYFDMPSIKGMDPNPYYVAKRGA